MEKLKSFIPKPINEPKEYFALAKQRAGGTSKVALRRSKSALDVRTVAKLEIKKPVYSSTSVQQKENIGSKQVARPINKPRKSRSVSNLSSISSTLSVKTINIKKPVMGTKRTLPNEPQKLVLSKRSKAEETKAGQKQNQNVAPQKPARAPKPPNYDYKARFNLLNDKHLTLRTAHNDLKIQFSEMQNESDSMKNEHMLLLARNDELEKDRVNLNLMGIKYEAIEKEKCDLEKAMKQLMKEMNDLREKYTILQEKHDINLKTFEVTQNTLMKKTTQLECTSKQLEECKNELNNNEAIRRELHNKVQDLKGNIRVFCRIRPSLSTENDRALCNMTYIDEATLELRARENSKSEFTFDKVFPPESTQHDIFEDMAGLVQSALDGYHVCVFAYGQTGSGKTYTMLGESGTLAQGMIPRSMDLLFESINRLQKVGWEYKVEASFLEIYNETIRDLLDTQQKQHEIRFNDGKGVTVTNLKIQPIESVEDFNNLMTTAAIYRAVATTNFNEHSSRSHAVTKVYISGVNKDFNVAYVGSLNLIDLAGSESAKTSSDERLKETKNINRSLSALGNVILALHRKENHVPFRNSKLTYLLQSCLAGNSKTLMVVNVSPLEECYNETINSLRFAFKVKGVKVNSRRNKTYLPAQECLL